MATHRPRKLEQELI